MLGKKKVIIFGILAIVLVIGFLVLRVGFDFTGRVVEEIQTTTKTYIHAGTLLASKSSDSENVDYYIQDHLGSNRKIINGQMQIEENKYYDFGETTEEQSSGNNYKYTGKELDDETNLYYYGARYYKPEFGRFVQADVLRGDISDPLSLNRYVYVKNNPLKFVDPSGNQEEVIFEFWGLKITRLSPSPKKDLYEERKKELQKEGRKIKGKISRIGEERDETRDKMYESLFSLSSIDEQSSIKPEIDINQLFIRLNEILTNPGPNSKHSLRSVVNFKYFAEVNKLDELLKEYGELGEQQKKFQDSLEVLEVGLDYQKKIEKLKERGVQFNIKDDMNYNLREEIDYWYEHTTPKKRKR